MFQKIVEFFQQNQVISLIIASVIAFNILMTGLKAALEVIKDKTATQVDNKIYDVVNKIVSFLSKIVEFVSANTVKK